MLVSINGAVLNVQFTVVCGAKYRVYCFRFKVISHPFLAFFSNIIWQSLSVSDKVFHFTVSAKKKRDEIKIKLCK